jgi:hypothetical protein
MTNVFGDLSKVETRTKKIGNFGQDVFRNPVNPVILSKTQLLQTSEIFIPE